MKKVVLICFITFSLIFETNAQITFEKTYGTIGFEEAKSVRQTFDGGYILGGTNLVKLDALGGIEWTKPYSSLFANPTADSAYILINHNSNSITFTKIGTNGDSLWQTNFSAGIWANEGYYIEQVEDGGYIVAGRYQSVTGSGMLLLKLNGLGQQEWRRTFSEITSAGFNDGFSVQQTLDKGFIIVGRTNINYYDPSKHKDVFIVKTDSIGGLQWQRFYGGSDDDSGFSVRQNFAGDYYIGGTTNSFGTGIGSNMYLIKLNTFGDSLWTRTYGGNFEESAIGLWPTNDGGCILTGSSNSFSTGDFDGYIVKTDANGDILWTRTYGGTGMEVANSVQQTSDNGYAIAGYTNSIGAGDFDMFLLKTDAFGNSQLNLGQEEPPGSFDQIRIYPNPTIGHVNIELISIPANVAIKIYNAYEQVVFQAENTSSQINQFELDQPTGIYILEVNSEGISRRFKLIKE